MITVLTKIIRVALPDYSVQQLLADSGDVKVSNKASNNKMLTTRQATLRILVESGYYH